MRTNGLGFIRELDSLRFFAVLLVIIFHWAPHFILNRLPNAYIGVSFFFVLSGFLISSNLLYQRKAIEKSQTSFGKAISNFYSRRFLRIFPLYYLVLFVVLALNKSIFKGDFVWYIGYASNFLIYIKQDWPGMLSHFWSLAVEEQFYLIWPFLLLMTSQKLIPTCLWITLGISISYKLYAAAFVQNQLTDLLPISAFDSFAVGGFLAYSKVYGRKVNFLSHKWLPFFSIALLVCMILFIYDLKKPIIFALPFFSILIISKAVDGFDGIPGQVLNNPLLVYLGKISYGLYILHNFIPWLFRCLRGTESQFPINIPAIFNSWNPTSSNLFLMQFLLLIMLASLSWFTFEKPINSLKKRFA